MKSSQFNYFIPNDDNIIIFNGNTEKFYEFPSSKLNIYREILENPDKDKKMMGSILNRCFNYYNENSVE